MKLTVYKCDACKKVLSDEPTALPHFNSRGGLELVKCVGNGRWVRVGDTFFPRYGQLCIDCLIFGVNELITRAKMINPTEKANP